MDLAGFPAHEYARSVKEYGKFMKMTDPSIETVACGSTGWGMPSFGDWERTVLGEAYDQIDYMAIHFYPDNPGDDQSFFDERRNGAVYQGRSRALRRYEN
jgi:alpha-N-arabinofuranosidase